MNIWLAFANYPVTTAVYLERVLRRSHNVTTIGPQLPAEAIEAWQLQNLNRPLGKLDIDTSFTPDMEEIVRSCTAGNLPDIYLWVESVNGHSPQNLSALRCPKACYLIDTHYHLHTALAMAEQFDYVFIAQLIDLEAFRSVHPRAYWLPLACDPEIHARHPIGKSCDIGFVGGMNPRRANILKHLGAQMQVHSERSFWHDMARTLSAARMVLNDASFDDLNMRFFEALSIGSLLLSNRTNDSGQDILFRDGGEYARYNYANILEVARFYLDNEQLREEIAEQGRLRVFSAHTYRHRLEDLLDVVLHDKRDTFSPYELRERSMSLPAVPPGKIENERIAITSPPPVTLVIQADRHTPESLALLTPSLRPEDGCIIVGSREQRLPLVGPGQQPVTRDAEEEMRTLDDAMRSAPTEAVILAEPGITLPVDAAGILATALEQCDKAACVAPWGTFVNYSLMRDFQRISGMGVGRPVQVDAAPLSLLCLSRSRFLAHGLSLQSRFSDLRLQEYDLGLGITACGLGCWAVPVPGFDTEHASPSPPVETVAHEIALFRRTWQSHPWQEETSSHWYRFATMETERQVAAGRFDEAIRLLDALYYTFNDLPVLQEWGAGIAATNRFFAAYLHKLSRLPFVFGTP